MNSQLILYAQGTLATWYFQGNWSKNKLIYYFHLLIDKVV